MHAATPPRVLAVTEDATLVIGLTFLPEDWEVESQPSFEGGADAEVVVVDLGTTAAALEAIAAFDGELPSVVVVGDRDADDAPDGVQVLVRPYVLDDLAGRVRALLEPEPPAEPVAEIETEPAGEGSVAAEAPPPAGWVDAPEAAGPPPLIDTPVAPPVEEPAEPTVPEPPSEPQEPVTDRLSGWVSRLRRREQAPEDVQPAPVVDLAAEEPPAASAEAPVGAAETVETSAASAEAPEETATPVEDAPPASAEAPDAGAEEAAEAPAALAEAPVGESEAVESAPAASAEAPADAQQAATPRRSRWIGRRPRGDDAESDLRRRLAGALTASAELERLVADLPLLRSFPALSLAVARMIEEQLEADTVAVWRPEEDGWHAVAHRGLSRIEAEIVVAPKHPLFAQVDASGGALLIDPVDSAQGVVAGIGGAHTESFMAASIAIGPGRYGIVTVGRDQPLGNRDLDRLVDTVLEAAIGLALADWFERVAGLANSDRSERGGGRRSSQDDEPADEAEPVEHGRPAEVIDIRQDVSVRP